MMEQHCEYYEQLFQYIHEVQCYKVQYKAE